MLSIGLKHCALCGREDRGSVANKGGKRGVDVEMWGERFEMSCAVDGLYVGGLWN